MLIKGDTQHIERLIHKIAVILRAGGVTPASYISYIFPLLIIKYVSDIQSVKYIDIIENKQLKCFVGLLSENTFEKLRDLPVDKVGDSILSLLRSLEENMPLTFGNVFLNMSLSKPMQGQGFIWSKLLNVIDSIKFESEGELIYKYGEIASQCIRSLSPENRGEPLVWNLIGALVPPNESETVYDPCCGSGGLLTHLVGREWVNKLSGDEINPHMWAISKANLTLHSIDNSKIKLRNSVVTRYESSRDQSSFDVVVSHFPLSLRNWGNETMNKTLFTRGAPPKSNGDYAFISLIIDAMDKEHGRAATMVSEGALSREGSEGQIRKALIEENLVDTVISLPSNLFHGTSVSTSIIVFKKKKDRSVLFIDASGINYKRNAFNSNDLDFIVSTFKARESRESFSYLADIKEVRMSKYKLMPHLYVPDEIQDERVDVELLQEEISFLETALVDTQREIYRLMNESVV